MAESPAGERSARARAWLALTAIVVLVGGAATLLYVAVRGKPHAPAAPPLVATPVSAKRQPGTQPAAPPPPAEIRWMSRPPVYVDRVHNVCFSADPALFIVVYGEVTPGVASHLSIPSNHALLTEHNRLAMAILALRQSSALQKELGLTAEEIQTLPKSKPTAVVPDRMLAQAGSDYVKATDSARPAMEKRILDVARRQGKGVAETQRNDVEAFRAAVLGALGQEMVDRLMDSKTIRRLATLESDPIPPGPDGVRWFATAQLSAGTLEAAEFVSSDCRLMYRANLTLTLTKEQRLWRQQTVGLYHATPAELAPLGLTSDQKQRLATAPKLPQPELTQEEKDALRAALRVAADALESQRSGPEQAVMDLAVRIRDDHQSSAVEALRVRYELAREVLTPEQWAFWTTPATQPGRP